MKKKKLVIFLLIAVMVLSLAVTALVGCNRKLILMPHRKATRI